MTIGFRLDTQPNPFDAAAGPDLVTDILAVVAPSLAAGATVTVTPATFQAKGAGVLVTSITWLQIGQTIIREPSNIYTIPAATYGAVAAVSYGVQRGGDKPGTAVVVQPLGIIADVGVVPDDAIHDDLTGSNEILTDDNGEIIISDL